MPVLRHVLLLCLVVAATCPGMVTAESNAGIENKSSQFDVSIGDNKILRKVGYTYIPDFNEWELDFIIQWNSMVVENASRELDDECLQIIEKVFDITDTYTACSISLEEYSIALDNSLSIIKNKYHGNIHHLIINYYLVDELWWNVVDAIKSRAKNIKGVLDIKNREIILATKRAIEGSETMSITCEVLKRHGYLCVKGVGIDDAVFFDKDEIFTAGDVGIDRKQSFLVDVEKCHDCSKVD